jgi:hypothetical protein
MIKAKTNNPDNLNLKKGVFVGSFILKISSYQIKARWIILFKTLKSDKQNFDA